jgi:hypothetical protein
VVVCVFVRFIPSVRYIFGIPLGASPEYPRVPPEYPVNTTLSCPQRRWQLSSWHITEHIPRRIHGHTCVCVCTQLCVHMYGQGTLHSASHRPARADALCSWGTHSVLTGYLRNTSWGIAAFSRRTRLRAGCSCAHFGPKPRADHRHADERCCP